MLFKVLSSIARGIYGFVALVKYDAFIFTWGNSLWRWNLDFYLLKFLGKKLVLNLAYGSDMRLPYASGGYQQNEMSDKKFSSYLHKNFDADAGINKNVTKLFNLIHKRGHEIGIHPGYNTYNSRENINKTYELLVKTFRKEGINQKTIGSRQHYLRWSTTQTPRILQENNISFDTTLGYADMAGFRSGTCREYSMFEAVRQKQLSLKQKPLIVMDASIFDKKYMNMDRENGLKHILKIKSYCEK